MALTDKQALFVDEYLKCFNATQAALAAGYSEKSARQIGAENRTKPFISEAIAERLQESAMSADEVLMRLAEHARGDIDNYLSDDGHFDLAKARGAKHTKLIRKFKTRTTARLVGDEEIKTTETEIELYDSQAALALLGKYHKLFIDKTEIEHSGAMQTDVTVYMPENGRE